MKQGVNKERIKKLVDALRSGKYVQADSRLRRPDTKRGKPQMCCLGVACDVSDVGSWQPETVDYQGVEGHSYFTEGDEPATVVLPRGVVLWYGFDNYDPPVIVEGREIPLSVVNDTHGYSFSAIADLIERTYL